MNQPIPRGWPNIGVERRHEYIGSGVVVLVRDRGPAGVGGECRPPYVLKRVGVRTYQCHRLGVALPNGSESLHPLSPFGLGQ